MIPARAVPQEHILPGSKHNGPINNYSGNQNPSTGILTWIPSSWIGYMQLMRLVPPVGIILIFLPHVFGLVHAAIRLSTPPDALLRPFAILLGGSIFVTNASHIWNDLIDANLDLMVARTARRPIPRGAVSPSDATAVMGVQVLVAILFLHIMNSSQAWVLGIITSTVITYYPFAKRHMYFPQFILGLCMALAVLMGELALDDELLSFNLIRQTDESLEKHISITCLMCTVLFWTVIYDTVYAHQDFKHDAAAGIKSFTILCGKEGTKPVLWVLLAGVGTLLGTCGYLSDFGAAFYAVALGGTMGSLATMITRVELDSEESCWWWFSKGFWYSGGSIIFGLLLEYLSIMVT